MAPFKHQHPIGRIVVGSVAAGLTMSAFVVFGPFLPADENGAVGGVLLGFAVGWALLAGLSARFSDQPQRSAWGPAVVMAAGGSLALLSATGRLEEGLGWVWPPAVFILVGWSWLRARRDLQSKSRVLVLYPVLVALLLASLGGAYERLGASLQSPLATMPGMLLDVGTHRLHLVCTGSGAPTVVIEPGATEMSAFSGWITPTVDRETRICVYDRAGRGWSDPGPARQDGAQVASDLHALLHGAEIPGPYVLAGHSFGGLYVLSFAEQYPDEVAGMVLIDSTAPSTDPVSAEQTDSYDAMDRVAALASALTRVGLGRLLGQFSYATLPPRSREVARASVASADHVASMVEEYAAAARSASQAGELKDFDAKPLVVLTAGSGSSAAWMADQDQMATLSTNSSHRIVDGATHGSLMEDEADATAVISALRDVLVSVRTSRPLSGS